MKSGFHQVLTTRVLLLYVIILDAPMLRILGLSCRRPEAPRGRTVHRRPSCSISTQQQQSNRPCLASFLPCWRHQSYISGRTCSFPRLFSNTDDSNGSEHTQSKDTDDTLEEYRNKSNRRDQVFSAISGDGGIKVTACTARNLVNDLMLQHSLTNVPTDALGRTLICGILMANGIQDEQIVQITMNSDGPIRGIVGMANGKGEVRGYVGTPMLGDMPLPEAVGKGRVQIVKNHPNWPRPYNGITAIRHGDIDRDIGIYLAESEQRSCALAAATCVSGVLCKAAGGYLIEQLPDVDPDIVQIVERNLAKLVELDGGEKLPTNLLLNGVSPLEIAEIALEGLNMQPLQQIEPRLKCVCTEGRLLRALRLLPREEVEDILEQEQEISARCEFCGKTYRMGAEEVREKLETAQGDPARDDPE